MVVVVVVVEVGVVVVVVVVVEVEVEVGVEVDMSQSHPTNPERGQNKCETCGAEMADWRICKGRGHVSKAYGASLDRQREALPNTTSPDSQEAPDVNQAE